MLPLHGIHVIEFGGLAPGPLAGMILSDFGATVLRIDKIGGPDQGLDLLSRGKTAIQLDIKSKDAIQLLMKLLSKADVLIDPFRPGVLEKLGLGPEVLLKRNPRLVYARLTGYGQLGKYAQRAGHDINYIAISGILSVLGRKGQKPLFPGNLLGDFAGGSLFCVLGILLALYERVSSGRGQVIDASMVDGVTYLSSFIFQMRQLGVGIWDNARGENVLDSGAPFYDVYETKDGKYMAVGAIEPQFYKKLLYGLGLSKDDISNLPHQLDRDHWETLRDLFTNRFSQKTQEEWRAVFDGLDACVSPVVDLDDASMFDANVERGVFVGSPGTTIAPQPAPRLERTPAVLRTIPKSACDAPADAVQRTLAQLGVPKSEFQALKASGLISLHNEETSHGKSKL